MFVGGGDIDKYKELSEELGIRKYVKFTGYVSDSKLVELYQKARLFIYPSFYEGFGIPILEAGLLKRPVVCSNIPPHVMIGGDDVLKIDPYGKPEEIAKKIMVFLSRDITRPLFKRVLKKYTWRKIFSERIIPLIENKKERK